MIREALQGLSTKGVMVECSAVAPNGFDAVVLVLKDFSTKQGELGSCMCNGLKLGRLQV